MQELINFFKGRAIGDIKWAHAVNSQQSLEQALADPSINFLEVDISLSKNGEPIAAHYSNKSDLAFTDLLNRLKYSRKGLKLDFKDQNTVGSCLEILAGANFTQPIILNTDILSLKDAPEAIINPDYFIKTCLTNYPKGLLSLGWRTTPESRYELGDVNTMLALTKGLSSATFPVRASILPRSWKAVKKLLANEKNTLTIWNSDPINQELQTWINKNTEKNRCFYDFTTSS
jgi:hypothetical protein